MNIAVEIFKVGLVRQSKQKKAGLGDSESVCRRDCTCIGMESTYIFSLG